MKKATSNKLVIIGNGFDLAHGFKTSYNDFILWYLNNCIHEVTVTHDWEYEDRLLKMKRMYINGIPQKLTSLEKYKNNFSSTSTTLILKSDFLKKLIDSQYPYNWIDIEKKYYSAIVDIYEKIIQNPRVRDDQIKQLNELNKDFEFLRGKLEEYLTKIQRENIQKLIPNFESVFGEVFIKDCYNAFKENYQKVLFLNFNYTNTIEAYTKKKDTGRINYIHGKLNEPKNPIIFGFGDEIDSYYKKIEELNINEFLNNFKSFGYFKTNNYQNLLSFIDSQLFDVEILGHSCGLSDRVLLNTIFEHDNCEAIKIHYYDNNGQNDFTFKTQEISRHFNDKAKMRKRIVNFHECLPLKV